MKIYGISGLGADKRVFKYLKLDFDFIPIDWIDPLKDKLIPPPKDTSSIRLIPDGEHFMIVDRAAEISDIINREIRRISI